MYVEQGCIIWFLTVMYVSLCMLKSDHSCSIIIMLQVWESLCCERRYHTKLKEYNIIIMAVLYCAAPSSCMIGLPLVACTDHCHGRGISHSGS